MKNVTCANNNVEKLEMLDKYQGRSLSFDDTLSLSILQNRLIKSCFLFGIDGIKNPIFQPFNEFLNYYEKIDNGQMINGQCSFQEEQNKLYHLIHVSGLEDAEKLFLEFSVGLSRFTLAVQIISKFVDYLSKNGLIIPTEKINYDETIYRRTPFIKSQFFERIAEVSTVAVDLINIISLRYVKNPEKYWFDVDNFFKENTFIDDLAKMMVSIQYIPENKRFLSVMQTMHWRGFGGSGEIFMEYAELRNLITHAFSHHAEYKITESFNKRMLVFKKPLDAMLNGTQEVIVNFLRQQFLDNDLNVYDFCSGPHYTAVKGVFEKMPDKKFNLTVSDVDGGSLASLIQDKEKNSTSKQVNITDVCYDDLMLPMQQDRSNYEKYHLVSVNLGLHQLSIEHIYAALRHFTMITKIGGLISNLDASEKRYAQLMVIPGNLVDREGHVPYIEDMDLMQLIVPVPDSEYIKFAYPMVRLANQVISKVASDIGVGPYMVSFYTPVNIRLTDFHKLHQLWKVKCYDECDQMINALLQSN
jgi:hypothetical protein